MKSALWLKTLKTFGQSNVEIPSNVKAIMNLDTQVGKVLGYVMHKNG
jgi:hypothetical protein